MTARTTSKLQICAGLVFLVMVTVWCSQFKKHESISHEPINIDCDKHLVVYDSFQVLLATLDINRSSLTRHKEIRPTNDIVGQAIFNCKNGILIYITEEKMKSNVEGTLHLVFNTDVVKVKFEEGMNAIFPYGDDEILIRTRIIKNIGPDLGPADSFENERIPSPSLAGDLDAEERHIYLDDLIFNLKSRTIRKTVRGTNSPHYLHDGKFITYSSNKSVIDFSPENGDRIVLDNYRDAFVDHKRKTIISPQHWYEYFYSNNNLFLVNGETPDRLLNKDENYLPKNIIFKHVKKSGWKEVAKLRAGPEVAFLSEKTIISIGSSSVLKYNTLTGSVKNYTIPSDNTIWMSASIMNDNFLLAGMKDDRARLFIFSDDFSKKILDENLDHFVGPKISTMNLPIPPWQ